jgi:hypothetical protein
MDNLVTYNYVGGLGNQLFGIYTCISYALKNRKNFIFENKKISPSITYRITYWDSLFKNLQTYENKIINWNMVFEQNDTYKSENIDNNKNIMFDGYFQSYYNFIDNYKEINSILNIEKFKNDTRDTYYEYLNGKRNIAIHFRLGDYKKLQKYHPLLDDLYYEISLNNIDINEDDNLLIFCEKEDYELVNERMKNIMQNINKVDKKYQIITLENDLDNVFLMSLCDVIVIANSTFSWWAAFYSEHNNVYIPYRWFHDLTKKGLILDKWKVVKF